MSKAQVTEAGSESSFLFFSNPFESTHGLNDLQEYDAEKVFKMVKNGNFGLYRQQIINTFKHVGGSGVVGAPENIKAIIKLCLDVVAESCRSGKALIRFWFDPFTGRLELETANGLRDSLLVWSSPAAVTL